MKFFKKYGILAISLLGLYGLFILGSVRGFIGITGNVIDTFLENKNLLIYVGIGVGGLILIGGFILFLMRFFKKRKQKKKEVKEPPVKKISNNEKINDLLEKGGKALVEKDIEYAKEIYNKIKKIYNPKSDKDKKIYFRILNYYENILKNKK